MSTATGSAQYRVRRIWRWWTEPFRTNVDIYERTRIEWRLFPPRLNVRAIPASLQESVDAAATAGGGTVSLSPGRIHVTEPVTLTGPNLVLRDMTIVSHARYAIQAGLDA